jgi:diamine N-acetyltransferase
MEIWRVSNTLAPFSRYILKKYLETAHLDIWEAKQLRLVIETIDLPNPIPLGMVDLFDFDPFHMRAGVGILIADSDERGKGYAKHALGCLVNYAFNTLLLRQLYCNVGKGNAVSISLFKSSGFEVVGVKKDWNRTKNGWEDEVMLQLINLST